MVYNGESIPAITGILAGCQHQMTQHYSHKLSTSAYSAPHTPRVRITIINFVVMSSVFDIEFNVDREDQRQHNQVVSGKDSIFTSINWTLWVGWNLWNKTNHWVCSDDSCVFVFTSWQSCLQALKWLHCVHGKQYKHRSWLISASKRLFLWRTSNPTSPKSSLQVSFLSPSVYHPDKHWFDLIEQVEFWQMRWDWEKPWKVSFIAMLSCSETRCWVFWQFLVWS